MDIIGIQIRSKIIGIMAKIFLFTAVLIMISTLGLNEFVYGESAVFSIQVSSFKDKRNAEEKVDSLKKLGHDVFYREELGRGGKTLFRVYIERFKSRSEAVKEAGVLKGLGLITDFSIKRVEGKEEAVSPRKKRSKRVYYIHIDSFRQKENAERQVQYLVQLGQKAYFAPEEIAGSTWFRVYIGEFDEEKEAHKVGAELKGKRDIQYFKVLPIDKEIDKEIDKVTDEGVIPAEEN